MNKDTKTKPNLKPERLTDESFSEYQSRRKQMKKWWKSYSKGNVVWNSRNNGQYIKAIHGKIGN